MRSSRASWPTRRMGNSASTLDRSPHGMAAAGGPPPPRAWRCLTIGAAGAAPQPDAIAPVLCVVRMSQPRRSSIILLSLPGIEIATSPVAAVEHACSRWIITHEGVDLVEDTQHSGEFAGFHSQRLGPDQAQTGRNMTSAVLELRHNRVIFGAYLLRQGTLRQTALFSQIAKLADRKST